MTCAVGVTYSYIADPDDDCRFFICENGVLVGGDSWQCPTKPSFLSYVLTKGINQPCSKCQNSGSILKSIHPQWILFFLPQVLKAKCFLIQLQPLPKQLQPLLHTPLLMSHRIIQITTQITMDQRTPPNLPLLPKVKIFNSWYTWGISKHHVMFLISPALVSVDANSYKPGGVLKSGITTISDCIVMCQQDPTCFGFNFVTSNTTCYFHTLSTICNNLIPSVGTTHFSFYNCCELLLISLIHGKAPHMLGNMQYNCPIPNNILHSSCWCNSRHSS